MAENSTKPLTIFMYPWFAMGHLIPYILTANKLANRGHKVTLIVPQKAGIKLGPMNLHPGLVKFHTISIPIVEGLPTDVETTNDVTIQEQALLRHALDLTEPEIQSLLAHLKPDVVFFDLMHWIPGLARKMGIKSVHYSVVSPAAMGFMFTEGTTEEDLKRSPAGFPAEMKGQHKQGGRTLAWLRNFKEPGSGITLHQRFMTAFLDCDAMGFKTCEEVEGKYCKFLERKLTKPVLLAGPVVPKPTAEVDEKWAEWLKKFKPKTVIFCAFGSEAVITTDEFQQLLLGIELTNLPFIVALRPPRGVNTIHEALPAGFIDRTEERGIVYEGWVPQQHILNHPSVGCFITHCGYGSTWEGLMSDCQLVALPHVADQYVDARLLSEDLRVAVEVEKGEEDGSVTKEAVRAAVIAATAEDSEVGREIKRNHEKLRKILVQEDMEDKYIDGFIHGMKIL